MFYFKTIENMFIWKYYTQLLVCVFLCMTQLKKTLSELSVLFMRYATWDIAIYLDLV